MQVEMGFAPDATPTLDHGPADDAEVLIVGAGVSGLALAVRLDRAGIRHTIVEKNDDVGGTWLENGYPGAGVDTPSRSEEHTSELQSLMRISYAVYCFKKKKAARGVIQDEI